MAFFGSPPCPNMTSRLARAVNGVNVVAHLGGRVRMLAASLKTSARFVSKPEIVCSKFSLSEQFCIMPRITVDVVPFRLDTPFLFCLLRKAAAIQCRPIRSTSFSSCEIRPLDAIRRRRRRRISAFWAVIVEFAVLRAATASLRSQASRYSVSVILNAKFVLLDLVR